MQHIDLYQAIATAELNGRNVFMGIEEGLRRLEIGMSFAEDELHPYHYAMMALNHYGGILCSPLELMKFQFPRATEEIPLSGLREVVRRVRSIAERVLMLEGVANIKCFLRRFSFKFKRIFTPGWLESRKYTRRNLERVLNAASKCARNFLTWLAGALQRLELRVMIDDMGAIRLSAYARRFILLCDRKTGTIVMIKADGETRMFAISPKAKMAWRVIRVLMEGDDAEGEARLPKNALSQFRNTDGDNQLKKNDLQEFVRYIHSTGNAGCYCLRPYPKRGYEH